MNWTAYSHGAALCASLIVSSTVMSIAAGGRHEALFLSLLHIMLGSAMLVPWESQWQLGLGALSMLAMLASTIFGRTMDPNLFYHWLGVITAVALCAAVGVTPTPNAKAPPVTWPSMRDTVRHVTV